MRALVIDDSRIARRFLSRTLRTLGIFDAAEAATGSQAIERVRQDAPYDLILIDLMMPGMDGLEVLKSLRAEAKTRDAAMLVVSSEGDPQLIFSAIRAGAQGYVTKPFGPSAIRRRLLELRRQSQVAAGKSARIPDPDDDMTPAPGRVTLDGELGELTVLELLQFLSVQAKSGELRLSADGLTASLRLRKGSIVAAQATLREPIAEPRQDRVIWGEAALSHIVLLEHGRFWLVGPEYDLPPEAAVKVPTLPLLLELAGGRKQQPSHEEAPWS